MAEGPAGGSVPAVVRIGAYNIQIFGKTKASRPNTLGALARVGASFDAMTVEEVGSNGSTATEETCQEVMSTYVEKIREVSGGAPYAFVRGDQFAVVYRSDRFQVEGWNVYDGPARISYPPLIVYFQTRDAPFDFILVVVHTRPSRAAEEIAALKEVIVEASKRYGESDVICLGDYNADGDYYSEGQGEVLSGFDSSSYISVIPNDADTTVAKGSKAYDRMILTADLSEDYDGVWNVLRPGSLWDLSACEGGTESAGTEAALSDHYPIWAEFRTQADDD